MKRINSIRRSLLGSALALTTLTLAQPAAHAANGTWTNLTSGGLWNIPGNWSGGTVADSSGSTAYFNTLDLTADNLVRLDGSHTLTGLIFGDLLTGTAGGWFLDNNATPGNLLTLAGTTPTITVNALGTAKTATIGAVIAGSAGLTKAGAGTLTLTNVNTFTGGLTLKGGTLLENFTSLATPTDLINSGNTLTLGGAILSLTGNSTADTSQTLGNVTVNAGGGQILVNPNGSARTATLNLGTITANAAGSSLLVGKAAAASGTNIITTGSNTNSPGGIYGGRVVCFNGTANTGYDWATTASGSSPYALSPLASGGYTALPTSGGSSTVNYSMTAATALAGSFSLNTLKLEAPSGDLALGGNTLTISGGGLLMSGTTGRTISGTFGANKLTADNGSGAYDLIIHQYNSGGLTVSALIGDNGVNPVTLTKTGSGQLNLSGTNTYTGGTFINAGTLYSSTAQNNRALGAAGSVRVTVQSGATFTGERCNLTGTLLTLNGGTWTENNGFGGSWTGPVTLGANSIINSGFGQTITGNVSGPGGLTHTGNGQLNLNGINTYAGPTIISAGTVAFPTNTSLYNANTASWTPANIIVASGAKLQLKVGGVTDFTTAEVTTLLGNLLAVNNNGLRAGSLFSLDTANAAGVLSPVIFSTKITDSTGPGGGAVGFQKQGANTLLLDGANTYTGPTTVAAGTLRAGVATVANTSGALGVNSAVTASSTLDLNGFDTQIGSLTGAGAVTLGVATLTIGGNNTSPAAHSGVISDGGNSGNLTKTGTGTLTLSGANTYLGTTTLNGGIINLGRAELAGISGPLGNSGLIVLGGGTLQYTTANNYDYSSRFSTAPNQAYNVDTANQAITWAAALTSAGGSLTKIGASTLTLAGANTYSGPTTVNAGKLKASAASNPGVSGAFGYNSAVTLSSAATVGLDITGFDAEIGSLTGGGSVTLGANALTVGGNNATPAPYEGVISGTGGSLVKVGTGTLALSGTNTYTGATTISAGTLSISARSSRLGSASYATASTYTFGPASGNLLAGLSPTAVSNGNAGAEATGPVTMLTDGTIVANNANTYTIGNNAVLTYTLGAASQGYDVTQINIYSGWGDSGRENITLTSISYSTVANPVTFIAIPNSAVNYEGGTSIALARLTATGGVLATNVYAIQFNFGGQENGYAGYRELEVVGGPPGPAPVGSLATTKIDLAAGATFDVSALGSYTSGNNTTLSASGTGLTTGAATLKGPAGGLINLNARPMALNFTPTAAGDRTHPALVIAQGNLDVSGVVMTVNNNGAVPLGAGTYTLIKDRDIFGQVMGAPFLAGGVVGGMGIAAGLSAVVELSSDSTAVNLVVVSGAVPVPVTLKRHLGTGDTSTYGDALSFDVTVSAGDGAVALYDGGAAGTLVGAGTLASGACTITAYLNGLTAGVHNNIVAVYGGDSGHLRGVSAALVPPQIVGPKGLTVAGAVGNNKLYDGTAAATLSGTLVVLVSGDTATEIHLVGTGTFDNGGAIGTGLAITPNATLGGTKATSYTLTQPTGITADILSTAIWTNLVSGLDWSTPGNWTNNLVANGADVTADFSKLNITVDTTVDFDSPRTIGGLIFGDTTNSTAAGWILDNQGQAANVLTLAGAAPKITANTLASARNVTIRPEIVLATNVVVDATNSVILTSLISGEGGLIKNGPGTLTIYGVSPNTYSGGTIVSNGTLHLGAITNGISPLCDSTVGTGPLTLNSGCTLEFDRVNAANDLTLNGGTVIANNGWGASWNGNTTVNSNTTVQTTYNMTFNNASGSITGAGGFTKTGVNTLILSGENTFTGPMNVRAGTLRAASLNSVNGGTPLLPSSNLGAPTNVLDGTISLGFTTTAATLLYNGAGETTDRVLNLAGTTGGVTLDQSGAGDKLIFSSNLAIPGTAGADNRKTLTLQGSTAGAGQLSGNLGDSLLGTAGQLATSVTKAGTGTWTLAGTNTYTGVTTISAGMLQFANPASLYNAVETSWTPASLSVASGATVAVNLGGTSEFTPAQVGTLLGKLSTVNNNGLRAGSAFGLDTANAADTVTVSAAIANSTGTGGGAVGLKKFGTVALRLSGASTYTGRTTINAGTVQAGVASVPNTSGALGKNSAVSLADEATAMLDITGFNTQIGSLAGGGGIGGNVTLGAATLTVGGDNTTNTYAGIISGDGGLTKIGTGTQTLSSANTYTGPTRVLAGVLACSDVAALAGGALHITNVAKLQLDFGDTRQVASLTLDGVLQPSGIYGSSSSAAPAPDDLHFVGSGTVTVSGGVPPPVLDLSGFTLPGGVPTFTFATVAGYRYRMVHTSNVLNPMTAWQPVIDPPSYPAAEGWSVVSGGETMTITDVSAAGQPERFYRLEAAAP
jgi:autotransporter-associated beta strand protein